MVHRPTRRQFLAHSLLAAGTAACAAPSAHVLGANERLRIAVAGTNGRGRAHIAGFGKLPNVDIAYVIDPELGAREKGMREVEKRAGDGPLGTKAIADVRQALDDPTVDALAIATPNHWHSLMTIWGAQAGKHVYVEKPMSHDIAEGRAVVAAQRRYGVVIQHGTQRRSDARLAGLSAAIKAGRWGRLSIAYGYCCKPRAGIGSKPPAAPPPGLDWALWKGPAVVEHYHQNLVHYNWHWFWPTGNGDLNNQGTHELDVARWAIDDDQVHPVRARAIGGRFQWHDQGETPNTMFAIAEYGNGQRVFFNVRNVDHKGYRNQVENEYYFEDGGRIVRGVYHPPGGKQGEKVEVPDGAVTPGGSFGSFVTAVREGRPERANGDAETAHRSCVLGHLMNVSYRLGQPAPFDAAAGRFGDDADAAAHFGALHSVMRDGAGVPVDGARYTVGPWLGFDPARERFTGEHAAAADELGADRRNEGFELPAPAEV
jgi:predicted dehydrogenase